MKRLMVYTALAAMTLSGTALAQGHAGGHGGEREHRGHGRGGQALMMLGAADLNGDNSVTRAELAQLHAQEFDFRDRNSDGFLDAEDRSPVRQRMSEMREERREAMGDEADADRPRRGRRGEGRPNPRQRLAQVDINEDGRISREEFLNRPTELFDRLDADDNDTVTPEELDAALELRAERRQARDPRRSAWWRD